MTNRLTDFSQLTKAMIKPMNEPKPIPTPAPEEKVQSREDADAAAVLAYFSRSAQNAPQRPCGRSVAKADNGADKAAEAALEYLPGRRPAAKRVATQGVAVASRPD